MTFHHNLTGDVWFENTPTIPHIPQVMYTYITSCGPTLYHTILTNLDSEVGGKKNLKNLVGNRENAGNQHFLFIPQMFSMGFLFSLAHPLPHLGLFRKGLSHYK